MERYIKPCTCAVCSGHRRDAKRKARVNARAIASVLNNRLTPKEITDLCVLFDEGGIDELFYNSRWGLLERDYRNRCRR